MKLNLDLKSIIILVLLGVSIVFFGMWFFRGSDKDKVRDMENQIKLIQNQRDSLKNVNNILAIDFLKIQKEINDRDSLIKMIEIKLSDAEKRLNSANSKLSDTEKRLKRSKKMVEELEKNPIKRDGDDLINSLKEKLK